MSGPVEALAPWQQPVWDLALAAHREHRLGHALLLTGPENPGKAALARRLAEYLLCSDVQDGGVACGRCRSCQQIAAGTHADFRHISFELRDKSDKLRTEIVIDQIRELGQWFSLTPKLGGAVVAVITPAEAMNTATANALLKTLEEPLPNRFLILVSDRPGRLPATIRSRCQRLLFRVPERAVALAWLSQQGHSGKNAEAALLAARGHPGQAHAWLSDGSLGLRESVSAELSALAAGQQAPVELAQRWLADGQGELRLRFAADLAQGYGAHGLGASAGTRTGLPAGVGFSSVSAWYDAINLARAQLDAPLRHDLLLAGLLQEWRKLFRN